MKNLLTKDEAINLYGEEIVNKLSQLDCEETGRIILDDTEYSIFTSQIYLNDENLLKAIYYQKKDDIYHLDDLGNIPWEVAGYKVILMRI